MPHILAQCHQPSDRFQSPGIKRQELLERINDDLKFLWPHAFNFVPFVVAILHPVGWRRFDNKAKDRHAHRSECIRHRAWRMSPRFVMAYIHHQISGKALMGARGGDEIAGAESWRFGLDDSCAA